MITNAQAIKFSDEKIRRTADQLSQTYRFLRLLVDEWTAKDMGKLYPNSFEEFVSDSAFGTDGTDGDGRSLITGADVGNIINRSLEILQLFEDGTKEKLNTVLCVAVNT